VCFHYEFEHGDTDIDEECSAGGCPSRRVGLAQTLKDWAQWDFAAFCLGRNLGLFESPEWSRAQGTFWRQGPIGSVLHDMVLALVEAGVLEQQENPGQQPEFRLVRHTLSREGNVE
jgi:hypothetical protein